MNKVNKCIALFSVLSLLLKLNVLRNTLVSKKVRRWWVKPHLRVPLRDKWSAQSHLFIYFALNNHEEFYQFCRMSLDNFIALYNLVYKELIKTSIRKPLSPDARLIITLHFLAHGGCTKNESWFFRVGYSTVLKLISEVCGVLCKILIPKYVQFPDKRKWLKIAKDFEKEWNFPNCIGALDGTHIQIQKPPHAGAKFKNYKKFHSLVLMALCDSKRRFIWFNFGGYGSCSDSSVFLWTDLERKLTNNTADIPPPRNLPNSNVQTTFVIVADEIFGLSKHIMKPFSRRNNLSKEEKVFNYRLSRARLSIECTFGILCEKWEIMQKPLMFSVKNCDKIVPAVIGLHNFIKYENEPDANIEVEENYHSEVEVENRAMPELVRNRFKDYFSSAIGSVPWQDDYI